ncbi:hypothetical protein [Nocardioides nitrophenolicus]|uniref:hypothetical protein n=1 Tax=Nocardioides nitrophenolicus TaxID=60489 RepID=UPI00195BF02B|nr:hypothetical protein [Nocardioides nitrophenolicus]MBM7519030.1 hypothetical protein [Nocardioides nitrophenolicus]
MADDDVNFSNYESSVTYTTSDGLDKLAEAMIDAYMRRSVPNVVDGSCKEGRFEIITPRVTINHQSDRLYVSYPGGHWTKDGGLIGDDPDLGYDYFDAAGVYTQIKSDVDTYLTPMLSKGEGGQAPQADDFDDQITVLQYAIQELSVSGEVRTTGDEAETSVEVGNVLVPEYISEIEAELGDLDGMAVIRLRELYGANRISDVMTGLHALAVVGGVLVAGEAQVWARYHRDFAKLIDTATADFHAFSEGNEVSAGEIFDVVKSVADASGLLSLPKGVANVIGKASTLYGIVKGFLPAAPAPYQYTLDGSSYQALGTSFWKAVGGLVEDVGETEAAFATCADNAVLAATKPDGANRVITTSFDLVNPTEFLNAGEHGIYTNVNGQRVNVAITDAALKRVSGRYELIGDHCHDVAKKLEGAPEQSAWSRGFGGATGGAFGHYASFDGMVDILVALLKNNGDEMHAVGEKCILVLHDFHATDAEIRKELDGLAQEVEDQTKEDKGVV